MSSDGNVFSLSANVEVELFLYFDEPYTNEKFFHILEYIPVVDPLIHLHATHDSANNERT